MSIYLLSLPVATPAVAQSSAANNDAGSEERAELTLEVTVTGVADSMRDNVLASLEIYSLNGETAPRPFRLRYLHRQAVEQITEALVPFGFYHVTVESSLERVNGNWQAQYNIQLNEPVRIKSRTVTVAGEAESDPAFQELLRKLPLGENHIFRHQQYEQIKTQLQNLATERGYFDAELTQRRVDVELSDKSVVIDLTFDSGPRYTFGDIEFSDAPVDSELLHRYLNFKEGDPFNTRELLDLQVALADSEYFAGVEVDPQIEEASNQRVPVKVGLTANNRNKYRFGLGYGTDTGGRITIGQDRRWVNERGHRFNGVIRVSEIQTTGAVNYTIPGEKPATDRYVIGGEVTDKSNDEQRAQLYRFGVSDIRRFDQWQRTVALNWQQEDFKFGDELQGSSQFLIPSIRFTYLNADDRTDVDHGYRVSFGLKGGSENALSDTNFVTASIEGKYIFRFTPKWRFLGRAEVAGTYVDDFEQLSPSLRFFAGGDNSVRGYAYEQLGPMDDDGVVTGGRYLAVASAEVDYEFAENWRVAAFTDIGNAMLDPNDPLRQSIGIGIRWVSPIGAIRLDVAQAIDEPDKPFRLHFTLGPDL